MEQGHDDNWLDSWDFENMRWPDNLESEFDGFILPEEEIKCGPQSLEQTLQNQQPAPLTQETLDDNDVAPFDWSFAEFSGWSHDVTDSLEQNVPTNEWEAVQAHCSLVDPVFDASSQEVTPGESPSPAMAPVPTYKSRIPRRRSRYNFSGDFSGSPLPPLATPQDTPQRGEVGSTRGRARVAARDSRRLRRSGSSTSVESKHSSRSSSAHSASSAQSASSESRNALGRRSKKRIVRNAEPKGAEKDRRPFKCTFCCDTFRSKFDWSRHEKSLHLDLERWLCTPMGGVIADSTTNTTSCAYCNAPQPDLEHLETHHHLACAARPPDQRSFRRKDHLAQHLRAFHRLIEIPNIEDWKAPVPAVRSRCGFCETQLETWDERADHLAAHFHQGLTMADWKGDHGFNEDVASRITKAVPPYWIASEARSQVPFSATDHGTVDHFRQMSSRATGAFAPVEQTPVVITEPSNNKAIVESRMHAADCFAGVMTAHLARFAHEQRRSGVEPTDEILQREARIVMYGSDDMWNQTIADNALWMRDFRRQNGLD